MTVLWQPDPARIAAAQVTAFAEQASLVAGRDLRRWGDLWQWSVDRRGEFWDLLWRFAGVVGERGEGPPVADAEAMPGARWFPGARLNYAENLLRRDDDAPAIISLDERGERREISFAALRQEVARAAAALQACGVTTGDRVAGCLPNTPEAVIAMLGTASLGAVWSSCSPDFGPGGILDRFGQIAPKVLLVADGYVYNGVAHDRRMVAARLREALPGVGTLVMVPYLDRSPDLSLARGDVTWEEFLALGDDRPAPGFARLPFDHPLFIMYSSGTTGLPKCMVHSAGGTLLQHLKEHRLHVDLSVDDRLFYFTTCGWMMWNWLVSGLASGAAIVLAEGSPTCPKHRLWSLAAAERVTVFGVGAKYLAASEKLGLRPGAEADLSALRAVLSTGSPLAPESFDWVYREVKADLLLGSISGGTDIISCFALASPVLPVRRGELQTRGLGMAVEVWDDGGRPVVGTPGELVCTRPFPSMPTGFWNDDDGTRYRAAYFTRFPGVWHHGDYAELRPEGGLVILGRSDTVLNPGGVRIGTAEITRVVEQCAEVVECLVVGQEWRGDVRVVLFVRLRDGLTLDDALRDRIKRRIRAEETPRHVPAKILQVPDLPRTISGKLTELAVRKVIHGQTVDNREALANPQALAFFADLPDLATD
jgi:acetoacetyl-CoA synthetase